MTCPACCPSSSRAPLPHRPPAVLTFWQVPEEALISLDSMARYMKFSLSSSGSLLLIFWDSVQRITFSRIPTLSGAPSPASTAPNSLCPPAYLLCRYSGPDLWITQAESRSFSPRSTAAMGRPRALESARPVCENQT